MFHQRLMLFRRRSGWIDSIFTICILHIDKGFLSSYSICECFILQLFMMFFSFHLFQFLLSVKGIFLIINNTSQKCLFSNFSFLWRACEEVSRLNYDSSIRAFPAFVDILIISHMSEVWFHHPLNSFSGLKIKVMASILIAFLLLSSHLKFASILIGITNCNIIWLWEKNWINHAFFYLFSRKIPWGYNYSTCFISSCLFSNKIMIITNSIWNRSWKESKSLFLAQSETFLEEFFS